jgi:hypothetical protein
MGGVSIPKEYGSMQLSSVLRLQSREPMIAAPLLHKVKYRYSVPTLSKPIG